MKKSQLIIIAVAIIILITGTCFKLGLAVGKKNQEAVVTQYKKIIDYHSPIPEEIFSIAGKITEIQDKTLKLETIVQDPYVLPDEWKTKIIKVSITDETKFSKFDPDTGKSIEINFSDLKVDNRVYIRASENIKNKNEFEAKSIELTIVPEIP